LAGLKSLARPPDREEASGMSMPNDSAYFPPKAIDAGIGSDRFASMEVLA
jgi:hypothetical protein